MRTCRHAAVVRLALTALFAFSLAPAAAAQIFDCVDYSNQPQLLASMSLPAGDADAVVTLADVAYVQVSDVGVAVVDWSSPTAPTVVATLPLPGGARGLDVSQNALYVVDGAGQTWVYDLADPAAPTSVGTIAGAAVANAVLVHGDLAYLILADGGLQVLDLDVPLAPVPGAQLALEGGNRAMAIDGDRGYVVGAGYLEHDFAAFHVVDLGDPMAPEALGSHLDDGTGWGFATRCEGVCVGPQGVFVAYFHAWHDWDTDDDYTYRYVKPVDVGNPAQPQIGPSILVAHESLAAICTDAVITTAMRISGPQFDSVPTCYDDSCLKVIWPDAATDDSPVFDLPLPGEPRGLVQQGQHVLVAAGEAGLCVVEAPMLADGGSSFEPVMSGQDLGGHQVDIRGGRMVTKRVFDAGQQTAMSITLYDITGDEVIELGNYSYLGGNYHQAVFLAGDNHVYDGMSVYELAGSELIWVGILSDGGNDFAWAGDLMVGLNDDDLWSWDISDPTAPLHLGTLSFDTANAVAARSGLAVVAGYDDFTVATVAADGSFTEIETMAVGVPIRCLTIDGPMLAVGTQTGLVHLYEVDDQGQIRFLEILEFDGPIADLALDEHLYVSVQDYGWAVVQVQGNGWPAVTGWINGEAPGGIAVGDDLLALVEFCDGRVLINGVACPSSPMAVSDPESPGLPGISPIRLDKAWPNPANPRVSVAFTLDRAATVQAAVYDLAGRRVTTLTEGPMGAGRHVLTWDGHTSAGREAPSAVYLVRVTADREQASRKILLAR